MSVIVKLKIEHPKFGILDVDSFKRSKSEIESKVPYHDNIEESKSDKYVLKYNSDYHTIRRIVHFPEDRIVSSGIEAKVHEHYMVYVDWAGY